MATITLDVPDGAEFEFRLALPQGTETGWTEQPAPRPAPVGGQGGGGACRWTAPGSPNVHVVMSGCDYTGFTPAEVYFSKAAADEHVRLINRAAGQATAYITDAPLYGKEV